MAEAGEMDWSTVSCIHTDPAPRTQEKSKALDLETPWNSGWMGFIWGFLV